MIPSGNKFAYNRDGAILFPRGIRLVLIIIGRLIPNVFSYLTLYARY